MKFRNIVLIISLFTGLLVVKAQGVDSTKLKPVIPDSLKLWKKGGLVSMNFSQVSLTNWAAGGQSSLSTTAFVNVFSNYKKKNIRWDNTLDLGYGFLRSNGNPFQKNEDKIELSSKFGRRITKRFFSAALLNFKSQFAPGYNYPNDSTVISNFMAPGYLILSTGIDYKPNKYLSFYASPVTGKITIVGNQDLVDKGAYGVDAAIYDTNGILMVHGKKARKEFGSYLTFKYKREIFKNVILSSKLDLFSDYLHHPENIDVNWDILFSMKVNKYLSTSISTNLIYDNDIQVPLYTEVNHVKTQIGKGPRTQFKEVLAVGLSYKF